MTWDPAKDEAAGEACRAYTAANVMRPARPNPRHVARCGNAADRHGRRHTTRLLHFASALVPQASWQGLSTAQWEYAPGAGRGAPRLGNLKVVTTNLRAGYVRKNGAPHSDKAVVTEYFDLNTMPNGDTWMTITTKVEDPVYFTRPTSPRRISRNCRPLPVGRLLHAAPSSFQVRSR